MWLWLSWWACTGELMRWEGGGQGLFGTLIARSAGDAVAAFHVDATPWKSGFFRAGLKAALGWGALRARIKDSD